MKPSYLPYIIISFLFVALGASQAKTIYVDASVAAGVDGTSWQEAYKDLQDALDDSSAGDEIWVAEGIYLPSELPRDNHYPDPRSVVFMLPEGITILGGFPQGGGDGTADARSPKLYKTLISGDLAQNDTDYTGKEENTYSLIAFIDGQSPSVLDGIFFSNSYADYNPANPLYYLISPSAGPVYVSGSNLSLHNCTLEGNGAIYGSAIYAVDSILQIENSNISNNFSENNGASIYCTGGEVSISSTICSDNDGRAFRAYDTAATMVNSVLAGNSSAILLAGEANLTATNVTVSGNGYKSPDRPVLELDTSGDVIFSNSIFWSNGSIEFLEYGATSSSASYRNCIVENSGGSGAWESTLGIDIGGNVDVDPMFVAPITDSTHRFLHSNLSLQQQSPAVDSADYSEFITNSNQPNDVRGDLRLSDVLEVSNTGVDDSGSNIDYLDRGAYEYQNTPVRLTEINSLTRVLSDDLQSYVLELTFSDEIQGFDSESDLSLELNDGSIVSPITLDEENGRYRISFAVSPGDIDGSIVLKFATPLDIVDSWGRSMEHLLAEPIFTSDIFVPKVIKVSAHAHDPEAPYSSWQTATQSLHQAIEIARAGDEIHVAEGIYLPIAFDEAGGYDAKPFEMKSGVKIFGGYPKNASDDAALRDPVLYPSVISGDLEQNDVIGVNYYPQNNEEALAHVDDNISTLLTSFGNTSSTQLDGIQFKDAIGSPIIHVIGSELKISNCIMAENYGLKGISSVIRSVDSDLMIDRCDFLSNAAKSVIPYQDVSYTESGNMALVYASGGTCQIYNSNFRGNRGTSSLGAILIYDSSAEMINCEFSGNDYSSSFILHSEASSKVVNCTFSGNSVRRSMIDNNSSDCEILNSVLWNNESEIIDTHPTLCCLNVNSTTSFSDSIVAYSGGSTSWNLSLGEDKGGNLDTDPGFIAAIELDSVPSLAGNLKLASDSAAIDRALMTSYTDYAHAPELQIAGREYDATHVVNNPGTLDLGAHEYIGPTIRSIELAEGSIANADELTVQFTFEDEISQFDSAHDLSIKTGAELSYQSVAISGEGALYEAVISGISGIGKMSISISDDADIIDIAGTPIDAGLNPIELSVPFYQTRIIYVDVNATSTGYPYDSWASATPYLQYAIDLARSGDEIWLAEGTYRPSVRTRQVDARSASYKLVSGISIYGGFPTGGGDGSFSARDLSTYSSILSGDLLDDDVGTTGREENTYHIMQGLDLSEDVIVDGVHLQSGHANGVNRIEKFGGAVLSNKANLVFTNSSFQGNSAYTGGAISSSYSRLTLVNCLLSGNHSLEYGGALFIERGEKANLVNCTLAGNSCGYFGGAIYKLFNNMSVANSILAHNFANYYGPYDFHIDGTEDYESILTNCVYTNSSGYGYSLGYLELLDSVAANPMFVRSIEYPTEPSLWGDYRLLAGSPAIDQGDNVAGHSLNDTNVDLIGNNRFDSVIDIGAYEGGVKSSFSLVYPNLIADEDDNGNGQSNYADYLLGIDPVAIYSTYAQALKIDSNEIEYHVLDGDLATDAQTILQKSTDLQTWTEMVEGVDYDVVSSENIGNQKAVKVILLEDTSSNGRCFYRRSTLSPAE
ncbi:right-handed parallel beta-helix repeat-containing protein [Persicirhabdus sediminis]|uniref:Right handed beta helix region n=1 Tax=Persicirhabdus sediminis TaxID=454144 RepID=A0A8J7MFN7_9BACT|nr:right-handed parallel beta-helix repeat-containing protein [Persicirhabdus sediminis]MBK1791896.1 hypothetical protein [Persicirhabdus sediminis]